MKLTDSQTATVTGWVEAGAELGDIQTRLKEEFDINLTYLDTRFLLGDLGLELLSDREAEDEQAEEEQAEDPDATPPHPEGESDPDAEATPPEQDPDPEPEAGGGGVSVTVDTIAQPHAIVSGRVTFSDGESAAWYLDQMGRLGLDPTTEGHTPSEADIATFQMELQKILRQQGF